MKKIIIIFLSLICLPNAQVAIPNVVEKIKDLIFGCTTKTNTIVSPKIIQQLIDQNPEKINKFIDKNSDFSEPLPFHSCTKPALFDLVASNKNKEFVEAVLQKKRFKISYFVDNKNKSNLFHVCAATGSNKILSKLLEHCKRNSIDYQDLLNQQDVLGQTPLTLSTLNCRTECLKILLAHNAQHAKIGLPLLHIAALTDVRGEKKRNKTVQMLLEAKHSPWEMDSIKRTAQDIAQSCSYQSTVDCIQKYLAAQIKLLAKQEHSYFRMLPPEIFNITLKRLIDEPADFASDKKPQIIDTL